MGVARRLADLARGLDPVHDGHAEVHEDDIRLDAADGLDRLAAVTGLGDHGVILPRPQERLNGGAGERVVVDENDADGGRRQHRGSGGDGLGY